MATAKQYDRVISADSHVMEPLDTWWNAIGHKYGDRTPRVIDEYRGKKGKFFYSGYKGAPAMDVSIILEPSLAPDTEAAAIEAQEMGFAEVGTDPEVRVKWQEAAGVSAEVMNTSMLLMILRNPDSEIVQACSEVFNDHIVDFCSYSPKRLLAVSVIPMHDVDWATKELERTTKNGVRAPMINCAAPEGSKPYWHRDYDKFWATAQDLDTPIVMHLLTGRVLDPLVFAEDNTSEENMENSRQWVDVFNEMQGVLASDFIFGGIFDRFPNLKIFNSEFEMSWVIPLIARLDQIESIGSRLKVPKLKMKASDYVRTRVWHGFIDDTMAEHAIPVVGASQVLWGSDFPHIRAMGLETQSAIYDMIQNLPREDQEMVVGGNTAKLFHI